MVSILRNTARIFAESAIVLVAIFLMYGVVLVGITWLAAYALTVVGIMQSFGGPGGPNVFGIGVILLIALQVCGLVVTYLTGIRAAGSSSNDGTIRLLPKLVPQAVLIMGPGYWMIYASGGDPVSLSIGIFVLLLGSLLVMLASASLTLESSRWGTDGALVMLSRAPGAILGSLLVMLPLMAAVPIVLGLVVPTWGIGGIVGSLLANVIAVCLTVAIHEHVFGSNRVVREKKWEQDKASGKGVLGGGRLEPPAGLVRTGEVSGILNPTDTIGEWMWNPLGGRMVFHLRWFDDEPIDFHACGADGQWLPGSIPSQSPEAIEISVQPGWLWVQVRNPSSQGMARAFELEAFAQGAGSTVGAGSGPALPGVA